MARERDRVYELLKNRLATMSDLRSTLSLLFWDQQTYMPGSGVAGRAEQRATKLPAELVAETSHATAVAEPAWVRAREESDWPLFAPHLEKILALKREAAEALGYEDHPYDALLDAYEPGAEKARLEVVFKELKEGVLPLIRAVVAKGNGKNRAAPLKGAFGEAGQEEFGRAVISVFGYDWERGRQDRSVHPFCINFGPGDVRITTRFDGGWLAPALFGTMHEAGHALYEQGVSLTTCTSSCASSWRSP